MRTNQNETPAVAAPPSNASTPSHPAASPFGVAPSVGVVANAAAPGGTVAASQPGHGGLKVSSSNASKSSQTAMQSRQPIAPAGGFSGTEGGVGTPGNVRRPAPRVGASPNVSGGGSIIGEPRTKAGPGRGGSVGGSGGRNTVASAPVKGLVQGNAGGANSRQPQRLPQDQRAAQQLKQQQQQQQHQQRQQQLLQMRQQQQQKNRQLAHQEPHKQQSQPQQLNHPSQRLPLRSDTIRHLIGVLEQMRKLMGVAGARADPRYRTILRMLRAHLKPLKYANFSFAQLQALKTQVLIYKLIVRNEPITHPLLEALRSGIACGRRPWMLSPQAQVKPAPTEPISAAVPENVAKAEGSAVKAEAGAAITNAAPNENANKPGVPPVVAAPATAAVAAKPLDAKSFIASLSDRRLPVTRERQDVVAPRFPDFSLLQKERVRLLRHFAQRDAKTRALAADKCKAELTASHAAEEGAEAHNQGDFTDGALRREALRKEVIRARSSEREISLIALQRKVRASVLEENLVAQRDGKVGAKPRERVLRQLTREVDRLERTRQKRIEMAEKEMRRARTQWLNALSDHQSAFRAFHSGAKKNVRAVAKALVRRCEEIARSAERAEREAHKARMQKLMHEDEEGYLEMVRNTKNKRLLELLDQTDSYLKQLGAVVKQTRKDAEKDGDNNDTEALADAGDDGDGSSEHKTYYEVAHAVKETISAQPSIMVGGTLKEYQMQGLQWMVSLYNNKMNGILADEMGLGKTVQTISLIAHLMEKKGNAGPYMVVVPLSTLSNWELEFQRWVPTVRVVVFKGDKKVRKQLFDDVILPGVFNVCLITYEYVVRAKGLLRRVEWEYIIVDEGHRMKNTEARLSSVLGEFYTSRHRLLLTGTPLQNSLEELWALLNFILPTVFSSVDSFEQWFAGPFATRGGSDVQLNEEESLLVIFRLHQVLRPFLLRRLKSEVLKMGEKLPTKQEDVVMCDMSAWQRYIYKRMVHNERVPFTDNNGRRRFSKMSNPAMQLRKVVNHPYLFFEDYSNEVDDSPELWRSSGKFDMLDACILKLLRTGHRILIFNQMTRVLDLQERLLQYRNIPFLRLDGSTRPEERKRLVEEFNTRENYNVFLLTTRAGGLGVNLQTADTVIIFDSDWNPQADLQAQDRAHRIGQKRAVRILRFVTARSVEEDVIEKATFKRGLEAKIIQAGMFDEQSKDVDRQAMLRELLREEEEGSVQEDALPTAEELNKMLSRSEEEEEVFAQVDAERCLEIENQPSLMVKEEIPTWVTAPEEEAIQKEEEERANEIEFEKSGRKRAAAKNVSYLIDQMSDDKYLAMMEKGVSVDEFLSAKQARKDAREAKRKAAAEKLENEKEDGRASKRMRTNAVGSPTESAQIREDAGTDLDSTAIASGQDSLVVSDEGGRVGQKRRRGKRAVRSLVESDSEQDVESPAAPPVSAPRVRRERKRANDGRAESVASPSDEPGEDDDDEPRKSDEDEEDANLEAPTGGALSYGKADVDEDENDAASEDLEESASDSDALGEEKGEREARAQDSEAEEEIEIEYEVDEDGDDAGERDSERADDDGRSDLNSFGILDREEDAQKDVSSGEEDVNANTDEGEEGTGNQSGNDTERDGADIDMSDEDEDELELSKSADLLKSDDEDPAQLASPTEWTGYGSPKQKGDGDEENDQGIAQWESLNAHLSFSPTGEEAGAQVDDEETGEDPKST